MCLRHGRGKQRKEGWACTMVRVTECVCGIVRVQGEAGYLSNMVRELREKGCADFNMARLSEGAAGVERVCLRQGYICCILSRQ